MKIKKNKFNFSQSAILALILISAWVVVGLILRLWLIKDIPLAYYHDEMDYVITGESLARFGTDLAGQWRPQLLRPLITYNVTAELTAVFHAITQLIFGLGIESGHLPSAIFGLLCVPASYLLAYQLTKDRQTSLFFGLLVLINPWHVHISRMAYEAVISLFFQIVAVTSILTLADLGKLNKIWQKIILIISVQLAIFLAFFTYHGAKITIAALVFASLMILWFHNGTRSIGRAPNLFFKLLLTIICITTLGLLYSYLGYAITQNWYDGRESELTISSDFLTKSVNQARLLSFDWPLKELVINKPTLLLLESVKRFAYVFDINRFMIGGMESGFQFSLVIHGFWYFSAIALFFLGLVVWIKNKEQKFYWWLLLIVLSPIATVIEVSFQSIFRSAFSYLILLLPVAIGIKFAWQLLTRNTLLLGLFTLVLLLEPVWFATQYFGRYGLVSAENHFFDDRLLAKYIALAQDIDRPVYVLVDNDTYRHARGIIAYNHLLASLELTQRTQFAQTELKSYSWKNTIVTSICPTAEQFKNSTLIAKPAKIKDCSSLLLNTQTNTNVADLEITLSAISSPIDSGTYYYVSGDLVCQKFPPPQFVYANKLSQFQLNTMGAQEYCQTWMKTEKITITAENSIPNIAP